MYVKYVCHCQVFEDLRGPQKAHFGPKRADDNDMDVSHLGTLCGSVLDASQSVFVFFVFVLVFGNSQHSQAPLGVPY